MADYQTAASTSVVVDGKDRALTPDEIAGAFTRQDGTRITDYHVVTHGWFRPRIRRIELVVTVAD